PENRPFAALVAELQSRQPDADQQDATQAEQARGLAEQDDPGNHSAYRTDASPDRISSAQRQLFHCQAKQAKADPHGGDGQKSGDGAGETFGVFQADGPADFEQAGEEQNDPGHVTSNRKGWGRPHGKASGEVVLT